MENLRLTPDEKNILESVYGRQVSDGGYNPHKLEAIMKFPRTLSIIPKISKKIFQWICRPILEIKFRIMMLQKSCEEIFYENWCYE